LVHLFQLAAALALVLLNGFFVAAEFALARARLTRLDALAEAGSRSAALGAMQVRQIDRYLAACQLGITLASLGLGWLGEPAFAFLLEPLLHAVGMEDAPSELIAALGAFAIITALHVIVGELAPKTLAIQRSERAVLSLAWPLEGFRRIFWPFIVVLNGAGNWLVRRLGVEPATERELASTPEDLQRLIAQSERGGALDPEEAEMLEGVFGLHEGVARDVMTPRPEVVTLDEHETAHAALQTALASHHSRFPVLGESDVLGVVHLSDLARALLDRGERAILREVAAPTVYVPETQPLDEVLRELQGQRSTMAIVLDEYGDLAGVVSVEDIIEEIVGEIEDERDRAPAIDVRPDGRIVVRGHVSLEDLQAHGINLVDETVTSVGGLVFAQLGRLPRTGDSVVFDDHVLTIEATRGTRILLVAIEPLDRAAGETAWPGAD
jgi:CBS domain containing-hemolysin-like protein